MADLILTRYSFPNTSDKKADETWVAYWDRKRQEAHGSGLHGNEEEPEPQVRSWRDFLAVDQEQIDPGDDLLPTRPAS
jgi:hypothetical protein